MAKAKSIRDSIDTSSRSSNSGQQVVSARLSEFALSPSQSEQTNLYRLYLDIGRERGTWMDPRWGASGRRIECTVDISFSRPGDDNIISPEQPIAAAVIKTASNKSSSSLSPVYQLQSAPNARLRGGFDKMAITDGGYCIEGSSSSSSTLRFCLSVDGCKDGDVSVPEGNLYFALPYFGTEKENEKMLVSTKEGTICVKQTGWNTGWRREESRILGIFRAKPLDKARQRDKF